MDELITTSGHSPVYQSVSPLSSSSAYMPVRSVRPPISLWWGLEFAVLDSVRRTAEALGIRPVASGLSYTTAERILLARQHCSPDTMMDVAKGISRASCYTT